MARFADQFLTGGKGGKTVLRAAMDKILPPEIVRRKKVGFRVWSENGSKALTGIFCRTC
ncbi:asparagine synthase-related protein [Bradyrhizobium sp. AUGA SZCCT0283]|uniref:asparagine synthase-related protein n=1 Tax=Bradyrhizobium sp. AUGA SZCCT0283 TaxID=2807671 RepID=UPI001BA7E486|nr:asparagine synthase-related protein [Bradyrhizobium sp. AUGA SZCCT0283]MBR1280393.1 hypothetical protein [Bradyrhizobium sp. AUGA SZCCT0283]